MKMTFYAAALCAVTIAVTAVAVSPADAQSRTKKEYVYVVQRDGTVVRRARTRVVVAPRSFLDAGTEVRRGERKFTDYAFPAGYNAPDILVNNTAGFHRSPLLGRWDLPANNNPYGW